MATTAEVPVNVSEQAEHRILELGLWPQFEAMVEHTKQATPSLRSISVSLADQAGVASSILILAEIAEFNVSAPGMADESTEWRWDRWAIATFPPDVLRHFCMMAIPAADSTLNGR
ncbi:MAG: hypothetical protein P4L84_09055 [Isosphaeraceae bacterium]|nr:hypothetical protein [Isosphaeraceae bacterium]